MSIHVDLARPPRPAPDECVRERGVPLDRPANAASLARVRAPIAAARAKAQPAADIPCLDRIGWAFSIATLIVWAITMMIVARAAP